MNRLQEIRKRYQNKQNRTDDDDGQWITTENGHKIHLNSEGVPDKGNPHVIEKMTGQQSLKDLEKEHPTVAAEKMGDMLKDLKKNGGEGKENHTQAVNILNKMPSETRINIKVPGYDFNQTFVKDKGSWRQNGDAPIKTEKLANHIMESPVVRVLSEHSTW